MMEGEEEVRAWIEEVTGQSKAAEASLRDWLKDGVVICELANALHPGAITKINRTKLKFKTMENIKWFLGALRTHFSIPEHTIFETVDLAEETGNLSLVVRCLLALKRCAPEKPREKVAPSTSVPVAASSPSNDLSEQLRQLRAENAALQSQLEQKDRDIADLKRRLRAPPAVQVPDAGDPMEAPVVPESPAHAVPPPSVAPETPFTTATSEPPPEPAAPPSPAHAVKPPEPPAKPVSPPLLSRVADPNPVAAPPAVVSNPPAPAAVSKPPAPAAVSKPPAAPVAAGPPPKATISTTAASTARDIPQASISHDGYSLAQRNEGRGGGFGLDAELERKKAEKYDSEAERVVSEWIVDKTGLPQDASFGDWLKDGKVLCTLANAIQPGSIKKIEQSSMPFKQMENISRFLKAARALGLAEHTVFETVDLYEQKDLGVVVQCLLALKARAP